MANRRGNARVGLVNDLTERKRAEEAIRQLNQELEQRVRARNAPPARASHDPTVPDHRVEPGRLAHHAIELQSESVCVNGDPVRLVALKRDGEEAMVLVEDNGIGIEADLLPRVFDAFTQGERSPERDQGGLGIGLTLVQRLVHLHGGRVQAYSDGPGRGSRFVVQLPSTPAPTTDGPSITAAR